MPYTTAIAVLVGLVLAVLAVWSRRGDSRSARWWVRRGPVVDGAQSYRFETIGLVLVPYLAQLAIAVAVGAIPGMPAAVIAALVVGEVLFGGAIMFGINYRRILPLFLYPRWLRPYREQEKAELRDQR